MGFWRSRSRLHELGRHIDEELRMHGWYGLVHDIHKTCIFEGGCIRLDRMGRYEQNKEVRIKNLVPPFFGSEQMGSAYL